MKPSFFFVLLVWAFLSSGCAGGEDLKVFDLRCENLQNPLGIDKTTPRFSWKIRSDRNATSQTAFQLLVASHPDLLREGKADLWDSGKNESSASILISYGGKPLKPGLVYYWKVCVWDNFDRVSTWCPAEEFSVGLLNPTDWQASYIGFPTEAGYHECPQLIKSFGHDGSGQKILLHVNSLGYHEAYLNGQKVGEGVLTPAVSQFDKRSLAVTYDITTLVKKEVTI